MCTAAGIVMTCILAGGCTSSDKPLSAQRSNVENVRQRVRLLKPGMSPEEVNHILGDSVSLVLIMGSRYHRTCTYRVRPDHELYLSYSGDCLGADEHALVAVQMVNIRAHQDGPHNASCVPASQEPGEAVPERDPTVITPQHGD